MPHIFMLMPLLALVLFALLSWQWALPLYLPIAVGSAAIARKAMQAQREPVISGEEAMTGDRAVVTRVDNRAGRVHCRGETWRAVSSRPLHRGQQVVIEHIEDIEGLRKIRCPVTVAHGPADRIVPIERARETADLLPRGQFFRLEDSGHAAPVEQAEYYNQLLERLIAASSNSQ